jgi:3-oxoadipate enol-lactonase
VGLAGSVSWTHQGLVGVGKLDLSGVFGVSGLVPLKTKDGRFGYEAAGDSAHPPLVFLHGIGGAARAWRAQLDHFGGRYRAIAWDMPGYGGSASLAAVSIASLADALRDFLQQVGATNPILVGHSIGGMIVQQLLATNPDIASATVLAQTSPAFGKPDGDWQKTFLDARLGPLDRGETMVSLAPALVKELVGDNPDTGGMDLARDCMASVPETTYRATMLALMGFDQRSALGNIAVPTLVLSGSKDRNAPAPMMAKMATYIPSARYVELEGAGHLVNLERPAAFNAALDQFLNAQVAATRVTVG